MQLLEEFLEYLRRKLIIFLPQKTAVKKLLIRNWFLIANQICCTSRFHEIVYFSFKGSRIKNKQNGCGMTKN